MNTNTRFAAFNAIFLFIGVTLIVDTATDFHPTLTDGIPAFVALIIAASLCFGKGFHAGLKSKGEIDLAHHEVRKATTQGSLLAGLGALVTFVIAGAILQRELLAFIVMGVYFWFLAGYAYTLGTKKVFSHG